MFFLIKNEELITINLAMQLLKERVEEVVFQILIFHTLPFQIFLVQIFLMIFSKVLEETRGRRRRRSSDFRGADLRYDLSISLEDAYNGKKQEINFSSSDKCGTCNGSGAEPGSKPVSCSTCGGQGQVRSSQGFFTIQQTCPECSGSGEQISSPCKECRGMGKKQTKKKIFTNIPKGVDDGTRIRLSGKGEAGIKGGGNGDLYIFVSVKNS